MHAFTLVSHTHTFDYLLHIHLVHMHVPLFASFLHFFFHVCTFVCACGDTGHCCHALSFLHQPYEYRGGENFATGIFRCGKFHVSNVCEISRSIFRLLCEINPVRNLATMLDQESFEMRQRSVAPYKTERKFGHKMPLLACLLLVPLLLIYTCTWDTRLGLFCGRVAVTATITITVTGADLDRED